MRNNIVFSALLLMMSLESHATTINSTEITQLLVGPGFEKKVFLAVSKKPTEKAACNTNSNYTYVFDGTTEVGKNLLSIALAAYASKAAVKLGGYDVCTMYSNVEDLKYINLQ